MDFSSLMQHAQEMGQKVKEQQEDLKKKRFEGSAGGGMVKAVVSGQGMLVSLDIEKSVIDPQDPEMLGDLVVAAVNDALGKIGDLKAEGIKDLTGGLDLSALGIDLSKMF